jgi:drug/metabolite transporter (DMT)-like permease
MTAGPWLPALAAAFFYGLALVLTQFGLRRLPPINGAAISVPTAAAMFVLLAPFAIDFSAAALLPIIIFAVVGLMFPATVTLLTFAGNVHMGPTITGAIGNLTPFFAVTLAIIFLDEPLGPTLVSGMIVVVIGVTLLTLSRAQMTKSWPFWAIGLPLAGALVRGITQPAVKWGLDLWTEPMAAVTIGYVMSALVLISVARWPGRAHKGYRDIAGSCWFVVVGLCNGIAVLLTYAALAVGDVSLVSPLIATYPTVTLVLGALFVRSIEWNARLALGVLTTVAGVVIILAG